MDRPDLSILLNADDVAQCWTFAEQAWALSSQSQRQFGTYEMRTREQFIADQLEGKLAEVAMQKFLARLGISVELNFTQYLDPTETDDGDIAWISVGGVQVKPRLRIDAKGTGHKAAWLLVEEHKFTADLYLLMKFIDLPEKEISRSDPTSLQGRTFQVIPAGWALSDDFRCPETGYFWFVYRRGDSLYNPDCLPPDPPESRAALREHIQRVGARFLKGTLDASINYGLPVAWLRKDWAELRECLLQSACPAVPQQASDVCERITVHRETRAAETQTYLPRVSPIHRSTFAAMLQTEEPAYSLVVFSGRDPVPEDAASEILRLLRRGVKIILAGNCFNPTDEMVPFLRARLLQIFRPGANDCTLPRRPVLVVDGRSTGQYVTSLLQELEQKWRPAWEGGNTFNYSQYRVEHTESYENLAIRAGAGAGKTTVMVDRVLYLLHTVPNLDPREVVMITFTRDAAQEMRKRLRAALVARYQLCPDRREWYRQCLERLGEMQIKTIHAFARSLMLTVGSIEGLGTNVTLREFHQERKRILEEIVNEKVDLSEKISTQLSVPTYKFVEVAERYWTEMENKGLTLEEIAAIDWGKAGRKSARVQKILSELFVEAECRLTILKRQTNAISLKDLIRWLDSIKDKIPEVQLRLSSAIRFLFVDEFQDTDDSQIRLILWLHSKLRPRPALFVVGDVKQSIYRFRGANWTAFDVLEKGLKHQGTSLRTLYLTRNYRTDRRLLDDMHPIFVRWGKQGLLAYDPDRDRLVGDRPGGQTIDWVCVPKDRLKATVLELIRTSLREVRRSSEGKDEPDQVAVLVRTNRQARLIREWCDSEGIDCQVETGGDFYTTPAVVDFMHLVGALLYPRDVVSLVNLYRSPYSTVSIRWKDLASVASRYDILTVLHRYPPFADWQSFLEQLRLRPVLAVLRNIIDETNPAQAVYNNRRNTLLIRGASVEEAELSAQIEAVRYSRNLDKLMQILHEHFATDGATLHAIYQFLQIKRATDRDEDQAPPTELEKRALLVCKTVHKAKGQEFHTVIVPFTSSRFTWSRSELLLRYDEKFQRWKAGWCLAMETDNPAWKDFLINYYYEEFLSEEDSEVKREETRLLYVAMTRAMKRLKIILHPFYSENCWNALLR